MDILLRIRRMLWSARGNDDNGLKVMDISLRRMLQSDSRTSVLKNFETDKFAESLENYLFYAD